MSAAMNITIHVETVHLHVDGIDASSLALDKPKRSRNKSKADEPMRPTESAVVLSANPEVCHVDADLMAGANSSPAPSTLIQPNSPRLAEMRDTLRRIGKNDAIEALAFISAIVGRNVERLGQLTEDEVNCIQAELDKLKVDLGW